MDAVQGTAVAELRPLSLGELLDRTFTLYRNHFWLFVGLMAVPYSVILGLNVLIQGLVLTQPGIVLQAILGFSFLGVLLLTLVVYGLTQAATVFALSEVYLGRPTSIREAYSRVWGDIGRVIFIQIILAIAIGVGLLLLIFPGVWVALRSAISIPVAIIEDMQAGDAIRRSIDLTKGFTGRVAVISLLFIIISWIAAVIAQIPFFVLVAILGAGGHMPPWLNLVSSVGETLARVVAGPLGIIAFAVLYFDLRVRKEGFDLKLMMDRLAPARPPISLV